MMNKLEQEILDYLPVGRYETTIQQLAEIIGISRRVATKYLFRLQEKGYIKKEVIGVDGGTRGDICRKTIIVKLK